jgi:general transcription factor 3C polypeptide 3 (transcription factor C subunit 4)
MRLLGREDVFSYLHIMHANNCLVSGTYKYALNSYISLFKVSPSALLALLIGVTQLQMACQKMSAKKNQLVIQGKYIFTAVYIYIYLKFFYVKNRLHTHTR